MNIHELTMTVLLGGGAAADEGALLEAAGGAEVAMIEEATDGACAAIEVACPTMDVACPTRFEAPAAISAGIPGIAGIMAAILRESV